jgi:hypothetical protein
MNNPTGTEYMSLDRSHHEATNVDPNPVLSAYLDLEAYIDAFLSNVKIMVRCIL